MACKKSLSRYKYFKLLNSVFFVLIIFILSSVVLPADVGLYKFFEISIVNNNTYGNKFADVNLNATFTAPDGAKTTFWGFYDGNGNGGQSGNVWKLRFMPSKLGRWHYSYSWSDGTKGGTGSFDCVSSGKGKGVIKAYNNNRHWMAYNGTSPVFLKSYYLGSTLQSDLTWTINNIYKKLIARGYNHFQYNNMLPVEWVMGHDGWKDEPKSKKLRKYLFNDNKPMSKMNLDIWKRLEEHLIYLNDRDIGVHTFQGFDGKNRYVNVKWSGLSKNEKDFYVKYVCSRLAPFANIAGWNYTWETSGEGPELELMTLLDKYDPWDHMRGYHDGDPTENQYNNSKYTFAPIEDMRISGGGRKPYSWSHHLSCLNAYKSKPVFMSESGGLWRSRTLDGNTQSEVIRCAWGVTTAGASFTWEGAAPNASTSSVSSSEIFNNNKIGTIDVLVDVMNDDVEFYKMNPHDSLLSGHNKEKVFALAEPGKQYLVFAETGAAFKLEMASGNYQTKWVNTKTGSKQNANGGSVKGTGGSVYFKPPSTHIDWVLTATTAAETTPTPGQKPTSNTTAPEKPQGPNVMEKNIIN